MNEVRNGAALGQPQQVNPQQAAVFALQFLEGVAHTRQQRDAFDIALSLLNAIATGQVVIANPQPPQMMDLAPADPPVPVNPS